jgi:hypothetical protein
MTTMFEGRLWVHYGQAYVYGGNDEIDLKAAFARQQNGLCGAADPGSLFLITGLHTGSVDFRVEHHDHEPPTDASWEEIVEVSFRPDEPVTLAQWGGGDAFHST